MCVCICVFLNGRIGINGEVIVDISKQEGGGRGLPSQAIYCEPALVTLLLSYRLCYCRDMLSTYEWVRLSAYEWIVFREISRSVINGSHPRFDCYPTGIIIFIYFLIIIITISIIGLEYI